MMAVIMFLFGMWFYKSEGKATKFLSGYNMKSADERKKYDENAMCKAYGKRMMFMSVPFIIGIIIDIQYQGIGCLISVPFASIFMFFNLGFPPFYITDTLFQNNFLIFLFKFSPYIIVTSIFATEI